MNYNQQGYNYPQTGFQQETPQKKKGGCFVKGLKILGIAFAAFLVLIIVISIISPDESGSGTTTPDTVVESSETTTTITTTTTTTEKQDDNKAIGCIYEADNYYGAEFTLTLDEYIDAYNEYLKNYFKQVDDATRENMINLFSIDKDYTEHQSTETEEDGRTYDYYNSFMNKNLSTIGQNMGLDGPQMLWLTVKTDHDTGNIVNLVITLPYIDNVTPELLVDTMQNVLYPVASHSGAVLAEPHNNAYEVSDKMYGIIQDAMSAATKNGKATYLSNGMVVRPAIIEDPSQMDSVSIEFFPATEERYKEHSDTMVYVDYK